MTVKGWCPGALRPMPAGDGLLLRLRPRASRLTADQVGAIAELAQRFGNGAIDLGSRATLQLRGIRPQRLAALQVDLARLGLIDDDPEREARRNIITTPFWAEDHTQGLVRIVEEVLAAGPDLPAKFGIAIDTGDSAYLQQASADLRLELCAAGQLILRADGCDRGERVSIAQLPDRLHLVLRWFAAQSAKRMRLLVAKDAIPLSADLRPRGARQSLQPNQGHRLFYAPFGAASAAGFAALATHPLRLTPWRAVLSEGALLAPPWLSDPSDPRLAIQACPGAPACPAAQAPTRALAPELAARLPKGRRLHLSGCAKGCASTPDAALTLTGNGGSYDLISGPSASGPPLRRGLAAAQLPDVIGEYFASPL